jgi:hypothetical protein
LDEYVTDGTLFKSRFEGAKYLSIYDAMLDLIDEVKHAPYHSRKWEENRKRWAKRGW